MAKKAVEIFAGGGGLAVGLRNAGFDTVAAVEINPAAVATFKANHKKVHVFQQDVRTVEGATLLSLAGGTIDVLAACPPCQGFSSLTSKWKRNDPRNSLVSEVARLAEEALPSAIMIENVPGLADKGRILFDDLVGPSRIVRLHLHMGCSTKWPITVFHKNGAAWFCWQVWALRSNCPSQRIHEPVRARRRFLG